MIRGFEARLAKIESASGGSSRTHEVWLDLLPPELLTDAERDALDAKLKAEAVVEHSSFPAAAIAYRAKFIRTRDPFDAFLAADMEARAGYGVNPKFP